MYFSKVLFISLHVNIFNVGEITEKLVCLATARCVSTFTSSKNSRTAYIQVWDSTINFYKKYSKAWLEEKVHASASSKPSYAYTLRKDVICFCTQCLYSHQFRSTQTAHTNIHIKQNTVALSMQNPVCWLRNVPIFISVYSKWYIMNNWYIHVT